MIHIARWKAILTILICLLAGLYSLPNVVPMEKLGKLQHVFNLHPVSLGLDLQGGSHLLLRVEVDQVLTERYADIEQTLRRDLRKEKLGYKKLKAADDGVTVQLRDAADTDGVRKAIRKIDPALSITSTGENTLFVSQSDQGLIQMRRQTMDQSIEIVRRRIDESGTKEPIIQRQGDDRIIVQLPGVDDPARIKALLGRTARLSFHTVSEGAEIGGLTLPMQGEQGVNLTLNRQPILTGDMLTTASPSSGDKGPQVNFSLNSIGARKFCDVTKAYAGKPFAIVLDKQIVSAPNINEPICGGSASISGSFTFQEATDLALVLRAGALPAPLVVLEERTVGPSLGRDSVTAGALSIYVATALVFVWMIVIYGLFGFFAGLALLVNMLIILAVMSATGMTLSLPGIAGIVLTIGMAVDANVLIFARIREEYHAGKPVVTALDSGYKQAMATIWDANMTTLIAGVFLFAVGAGPVKGFAVTLIIGLLASMFSAIMVTRLMIVQWLRITRPKTLNL